MKLELLTSIDMLWMVEKGTRDANKCMKEANKCMKDYDNREILYFMYWDVNDFYGWAI